MKSKIVRDFHGFDFQCACRCLPIICVYCNPADFPGKYVARLFDCDSPTSWIAVRDTLPEIRKVIPRERFAWINREPEDDPVIVEVWV